MQFMCALIFMKKKPYFLACPQCGHHRFVFPVARKYRCASCATPLALKEEGNYLIELVVLGPLSLVFYWCVAEILTSHGFDRDVSQWLGISAGFLVGLPLYGALRPYIVSVVHDESGPKEEPRDREKEGLRRE